MDESNRVSSVITEQTPPTVTAAEKPPVSSGKKAARIVGIIAGVLVLAYAASCAAVQFLYDGKAFPHTDVLGLDVSGQDRQQIEALWQE